MLKYTLVFFVVYQPITKFYFLDEILPRISYLAENSPVRKIKVAASELLHSLTVYMVGKSANTARDVNNNEQKVIRKKRFFLSFSVEPIS